MTTRWPTAFAESIDPLFWLNRQRKLRYVNPAWERLTGYTAEDALGWSCTGRRNANTSPIATALRPPREVLTGQPVTVRRAVPPSRSGPPWWDITFLPVTGPDGLLGILGQIRVVGSAPTSTNRNRGPAEALMALRYEHAQNYPLDRLTSVVPVMQRFASQVRLTLTHREPVWLCGEAGVGKQLAARLIHHHGLMREQTFALIDAARVPSIIVAGMLFGLGGLLHAPQLGTIYLREPGALSRDVQEQLVDAYEDANGTGPRVLVGSRVSPLQECREGTLSEAFFATFGVVELTIPPLRDRLDDLPRLITSLLARLGESGILVGSGWSVEWLELLQQHSWPGNLHELETLLQATVASAEDAPLDIAHLPQAWRDTLLQHRQNPPVPTSAQAPFLGLSLILEQVERRLIVRALAQTKQNRTAAADLLGLTRAELWRRIKSLNLGDE